MKNIITNGCPQPLQPQILYLDHYTNENDILKLKDDSDAIRQEYSNFVIQFESWMENNISVEEYRKILSNIPGAMKNNVPLLKDRCSEIEAATQHSQCSALLSGYHTWFSCSVLNKVLQLVNTLTGKVTTEVISSLQSYTKKMHDYCKRNILECPPPSVMSSTKGITYCIFKRKDEFQDRILTAHEIQILKGITMIQFNIEECALQLRTFTEGCVELVYSIPLCIYAELFPLNEDQCRYLTTQGLSEIMTKDYHYKLKRVSNIP